MSNVVHLHRFIVSANVNRLESRPYGFNDAEAPARFIMSLFDTFEEVEILVFENGEEVFWQIVGDQIVTKQKNKQVRSV